jgi:hypothetical protein
MSAKDAQRTKVIHARFVPSRLVAANTLTADDVAGVLAEQPNNANKTPDELKDKWVASRIFRLMEIPISAVGIATEVQPGSRSVTKAPVIVDRNIREVGRIRDAEGHPFGTPPEALVLDGKHRLIEAARRGDKTIMAYVGDAVLPYVTARMRAFQKRAEEVSRLVQMYLDSDAPGGLLTRLKTLLPADELTVIRNQWRERRKAQQ